MEAIVVYITAPHEDEAANIGRKLVEEKLVACVNIVRGLRSIYTWQGKIEDEAEVMMICKTRKALFNALQKRVKELHTYTVPEIIALPVVAGSDDYLAWLHDATA
jgi:periplasmic divalent cation tolerance protein